MSTPLDTGVIPNTGGTSILLDRVALIDPVTGSALASGATEDITIANGAATSSAVTSGAFSKFQIALPASFTGTVLTFTAAPTLTGTYQTLCDITGTPITIPSVTQGRTYDVPDEVCRALFWKIVSNQNEGGARTVTITKRG